MADTVTITVTEQVVDVDVVEGVGGSGSVTSFSSGNLSPLFTTSVATATTTPALTFSLSTQTANTVFAGPTTGSAAAPTFRALVVADFPTLAYWPLTGSAALTGDVTITGGASRDISISLGTNSIFSTSATHNNITGTSDVTISVTNASGILTASTQDGTGIVITDGVGISLTGAIRTTDKLLTINAGGAVSSGDLSGVEIEENAVITGYFKTTSGRDGWSLKAPSITNDVSFLFTNISSARSYTLPNASGTVAISASGNIALNATTGDITFTGDLPFSNLTQIAGLSVLGVTGASTADVAAITAGSDFNILRRSGTSIGFGSIDLSQSGAVGSTRLAFANLTQGSALSVLGVTGNGTADNASIVAGADGNILRRAGTAVGFGSIDLADTDAVGSSILSVANGGTGSSTVPYYLLASGGTASGANTNIYTTTNTLTNQWSSLGTTIQTTAGMLLNNSTDAAAGAQQISPLTIWRARGWKTNSTAASQTTDFAAYVLPVQGAANPTAFWKLDYSINGAAFTNGMAFGTEGGGFFVGTTSAALGVSNDIGVFRKDQNTTTSLSVINGTSNTAANASILIGNSTGSGAHMLLRTFSGSFSSSGMSVANTSQINSTLTGGLNIGCTGSAQVSIWTNNTQRISVTSGGLTFFGGSTAATAFIDIAAGVTGNAQLRLRAGVAPSSPNDGDMWYEDTNDRLMFRKAATGEVLLATAVTTEAVASDTTLTITFNGTTYKLLARA